MIHACGWSRRRSTSCLARTWWRPRAARSRPARRSSAMPKWWRTASRARDCRRGNEVICTLQRSARRRARAKSLATRARRRRSICGGDRLAGAVVAIGNAPTALFRLLDLLDAGAPKPAAILGIPVGFVGAAEFEGCARRRSARRAIPHRARAHGRQRHDRGRHQCSGEGRAMSAESLETLRRRRWAGRSRTDDAQGDARARRSRRDRAFRQGRKHEPFARDRGASFAPGDHRAAAALSGDDRAAELAATAIATRIARFLRRRCGEIAAHLEPGASWR